MQSPISSQYLASTQHLALLTQHQLASFEQLWAYEGDWFEPPNRERGGWSGVNFIELTNETGKKQGFYLKRQQGHMRRTWRHPIVGEPTFVREFEIIEHLNQHNLKTPKIVYFGSQQTQAVLLTEALADYIDLDTWLAQNQNTTLLRKKQLISTIATAVKKLHLASVQHRSLYPKHVFINENDGFKIAIIDFEKSRITPLIARLKASDLITLSRRLPQISRTHKLYFLKQYFNTRKLNVAQKHIYRDLVKK